MGIPRGPEDVTAAWLGSVLDADVSEVDVTAIGTGQTGATYRVSATYSSPQSGAARLRSRSSSPQRTTQSANASRSDTGRKSSSTRGSPTGCASRSRRASTATSPLTVPMSCCCLAIWRRRCRAIRSPAAPSRRPRSRWKRSRVCTAPAGAIRSGWIWRPSSMPKPGDDDAAKGLGDISKMAADIVIDRLGERISGEDQETLVASMASVTPWLRAEPQAVRTDARRLPTRQHVVRPRPHAHHRRRLADRRNRSARARPRLLHRDQPRTGVARQRSSATWLRAITKRCWVTASPITTSRPAGETTASARCRCRCSLRWEPLSRR